MKKYLKVRSYGVVTYLCFDMERFIMYDLFKTSNNSSWNVEINKLDNLEDTEDWYRRYQEDEFEEISKTEFMVLWNKYTILCLGI